MIPRSWQESEQAQSYMQRNPNSIIMRMFSAQQRPTPSMVGDKTAGLFNNMSSNNPQVPSFAAGGMMSQQGAPIRPGDGMQPSYPEQAAIGADAPVPLDVGQIDGEASSMLKANPQAVQQVQNLVAYAIQSGELTPDELNMAVQLAKTALANPASYPQVRQFAIQNGLGTEADIPQQMDTGILFSLIAVGKAMQNSGTATPGAPPIAQQKPAGIIPEYKDGGMTGDKPHIAKVHAREYIVPEKALLYHGKKHFDKLVEQANEVPENGQ